MKRVFRSLAIYIVLGVANGSLFADVRLPAIISDHMVLQANAKVQIWGWAEAGEKVSVSFADQTAEAVANPDKKWSIRLENLKPGTAGDITITGKNTLTVKDVRVGEVWGGSGQSNMEWPVSRAANADDEIAKANWPEIRMFTVKRIAKSEPQENCEGEWKVCSPETAGSFSAVAYYFGRKLHETLKTPIGLIHTSWGGTNASLWVPRPILEQDPDYQFYFQQWEKTKAAYPAEKQKHEEAIKKWEATSAKAKAEGRPAPRAPRAPRGGDDFGNPGCLFNGMIAPILPYTVQGVVWYQGESNAKPKEALLYRKLFPSLIASWRITWSQGGAPSGVNAPEMPFLFVQLANYNARKIPPTGDPEDSHWAELREAQFMTLELPRTAMASAIDLGEADDIHPKNKQEVGRRLALAAEALVYYRETEFSGPLYAGHQIEDEKVRLTFRNANGLKSRDGEFIKGFAVAGEDRKFFWATAEPQGDHVIVSCPHVPKPVALRYGWADNPDCNLVNEAGLPASPFRTDNWPQNPPGATEN